MANINVITFTDSNNALSTVTTTHYTCPTDTIAKILPQWARIQCATYDGTQFAAIEVGGYTLLNLTATSSNTQNITVVRSNGGISGYADELYCLPGETIQSILRGYPGRPAGASGKFLIIEEPQGT
jgi:hypothetical protein